MTPPSVRCSNTTSASLIPHCGRAPGSLATLTAIGLLLATLLLVSNPLRGDRGGGASVLVGVGSSCGICVAVGISLGNTVAVAILLVGMLLIGDIELGMGVGIGVVVGVSAWVVGAVKVGEIDSDPFKVDGSM